MLGATQGEAAGWVNVADKFTFEKIGALHEKREEMWQGMKGTLTEKVSDASAIAAREAFITAGSLGIGQVASGGVRGASLSARIVNTAAQSRKAVQAAKVANALLTVQNLKSGVEQTVEGAKQIAADPKDWHGYVNVGAGAVSAASGGHGVTSEIKAANKAATAAANVEKAVVNVEQAATKVEQTVVKAAANVEQKTAAQVGQTAEQSASARPTVAAEPAAPPTPAPATAEAKPPAAPKPASPTPEPPKAEAPDAGAPAGAEQTTPPAARPGEPLATAAPEPAKVAAPEPVAPAAEQGTSPAARPAETAPVPKPAKTPAPEGPVQAQPAPTGEPAGPRTEAPTTPTSHDAGVPTEPTVPQADAPARSATPTEPTPGQPATPTKPTRGESAAPTESAPAAPAKPNPVESAPPAAENAAGAPTRITDPSRLLPSPETATPTGTVKFTPHGDPVEFARQLKGQETGINKLTAEEIKANIEKFRAEGRPSSAASAIRQARRADPIAAAGKAGLHNPDAVIGGKPNLIEDFGGMRENSSLGSQNRLNQKIDLRCSEKLDAQEPSDL